MTPTPTEPATRRGEAVGWADGVRTDVAGRIEELVEGLASDADPGAVYVGWFAAAEVAGCPARFRAGGVDGWDFPGWSPQSAAASVGRSALARCVDRSSELPDPLGTVKAWMRDVRSSPTSYVAEWVTHLSQTGDRIGLAATAALAARWIAGFVRVVGWPFPEKLALVVDDPDSPSARRGPPPWRPRLSTRRVPVSVASKPDAIAGTVAPSGRFDVMFHRPNSRDDLALAERAAFEATAASLAIGIVPAHVVLSAADTGERLRFPVNDPLLTRGADQVVEVIRHRLRAAEPLAPGTTEFDDATPGPACRYCPTADDCGPGQQWLARPRRHNGLPVVSLG